MEIIFILQFTLLATCIYISKKQFMIYSGLGRKAASRLYDTYLLIKGKTGKSKLTVNNLSVLDDVAPDEVMKKAGIKVSKSPIKPH